MGMCFMSKSTIELVLWSKRLLCAKAEKDHSQRSQQKEHEGDFHLCSVEDTCSVSSLGTHQGVSAYKDVWSNVSEPPLQVV